MGFVVEKLPYKFMRVGVVGDPVLCKGVCENANVLEENGAVALAAFAASEPFASLVLAFEGALELALVGKLDAIFDNVSLIDIS